MPVSKQTFSIGLYEQVPDPVFAVILGYDKKVARRRMAWRTIKAPFRLARWLLAKPIAWIRHKRKLRAFDRAMQAEDHWRAMGEEE